ncbi:ECF transporter S component [uncultured Catenibacterium sp.]|uniref:ECF transporter S component n=1 Tax=uncultured Catenibacterium sp. TaxID=286142 RepID=UPI0025E26E20|nr:ECF transporter S component [uncultured Catenibacterium sp.]
MKTKKLVMAALLGALAAILMVLDFNVPLAPGFIKFDFSDFPVLIGGFVFGPVTGVLIAFLKIVLNLLFKPTTTMFVGEASNFILSVCYMGVACLYYRNHRTKKGAVIGMLLATVATSVLAIFSNILVMFPMYAKLFGMSMQQIVGMVSAVNPFVKDITTMVIASLVPFNLFKYGVISIITFVSYKKIEVILKKYSN